MSSAYPLRDALVDVLDRYADASVPEITDALISLLAAHVISEELEERQVLSRASALIAAGRALHVGSLA